MELSRVTKMIQSSYCWLGKGQRDLALERIYHLLQGGAEVFGRRSH
jgi:hypothetical protein